MDIFCRPDGSFGFELYRREPEDAHGWFPVGHYAGMAFPDAAAAQAAAGRAERWIEDA